MNGSVFNFDSIARHYDAWYDDPVGGTYDRLEKRAVECLLPPAGDGASLLEVGSGTGHWSAWFADKGYRITGIDVSEEMTRVAAGKNIPGARFIRGDFLDTEIKGTFDVVAAITSLEFIPDPVKALARMRGALKPGGHIIIGALNRRSWLGLARKLRGAKDPVFNQARFFTTGEIRAMMAPYGTPVVRGSTYALPFRPLLWSAEILERAGGTLCPCLGNFIVGKVRV
ncbi:MAG TPA: class I SAM-dependent methyltransferase [Spirochaetota bacterium]|nr:class I SAM-dependent methyltransferase [Spirochaetota bacterium]